MNDKPSVNQQVDAAGCILKEAIQEEADFTENYLPLLIRSPSSVRAREHAAELRQGRTGGSGTRDAMKSTRWIYSLVSLSLFFLPFRLSTG